MFVENLDRVLKEKKMNKKELAEMLGMSPNSVSNWKNHRTYPGADKLKLICEILEVSADELLGITEPKEKKQEQKIIECSEETTFHENLKKVMKNRKISQEELADAIGTSAASISYWLNNKAQPTVENFKKIVEYLKIDANELLGLAPKKEENQEELKLLSCYCQLTTEQKKVVMNVVNSYIPEKKQEQELSTLKIG